MGVFRELTAEEETRRTLIKQSVTSVEAMRRLDPEDVELALGVAKIAMIMQQEPGPFPQAKDINLSVALNPSTESGQALHSALGRAITLMPTGQYETPEDVTTGILSDIHVQAQSAGMLKAIDDTEYAATLPESVQRIVEYAREDSDVKEQIADQAKGDFHKLDEYAQMDIKGDFTGSPLPQSAKEAISHFYGMDNYRFDHPSYTKADMEPDRTSYSVQVNDLLHSGTSTGVPAADQAILTVRDLVGKDEAAADPAYEAAQKERIVTAGARLLGRHEQVYMDAKAGAAHMLNDIGIQQHASYMLENNPEILPSKERTATIASGQWHQLDEVGRAEVSMKMDDLNYASAHHVIVVQDSIKRQDEDAFNKRCQGTQMAAAQHQGMGM